jgi:hypothetical protein
VSDFLYRRIENVRDPNQLVRWDELEIGNQNTLKRIFDVAFEDTQRHKFGFTFNDVRVLTDYHVKDAKHVGVGKYEELVSALQKIFSTTNVNYPNLVFSDIPNNRPEGSIIPWDYLTTQNATILLSLFKAIPLPSDDYIHGFTFQQISLVSQSTILRARSVGQSKAQTLRNSLVRIFQEAEPIPRAARDQLSEAMNVETSVELLEKALIELGVQSVRNIKLSKARMRVFLSDSQTLDSVGNQYGLTRERARQIQKKVEKLRIKLPSTPFVLNTAKEIMINCKNIGEFQEKIFEKKLTSNSQLDPYWFPEFAKIICEEELSLFFIKKLENLEFGSKEIADFSSSISKFRSKIGVVDVHKVAVESGQSYETIRKAVLSKYKRAIAGKNLILAATDSRLTMFETVIVKQLLVNSDLSIEELREGIQRQAGYRGVEQEIDNEDYENLIRIVAGDPPKIDFIKSPMKLEIELSNHEKWLVDLFTKSETGILHRDAITEIALDNGISLGSLAIYLSYFPILRSFGPAIYGLVGTKYSEELLASIKENAKDSAGQTEIAYQYSGSVITLEIKPNIGTISSGVVFPPKEVTSLVRNTIFECTCVCGQLVSDQVIKVSKDGFWVGFSALFRHAYRFHQISDESKLLIKFELDKKSAQIFGNT